MTAAPVAAPAAVAAPGRGRRVMRDREAGWFAAPISLLALVFLIVPLVLAFVFSFARINPLSGAVTWVGVQNYVTMVTDPTFAVSLINTAVFTVITVPGSMALGLGLAVLMNSVMPARALFRTLVYLPLVISGVAVGLVGTLLFNETTGVLRSALAGLGLPSPAWQSQGPYAFASVILVTLWIRVGFAMIIYLAGLQAVPVQLLEAAEVEGASSWQRFRHVTLPLLGPATFFLLIMSVIYSFQVFDTVFVLTGGGPGSATEVLGTYAYDRAFGPARDQGYGSTIGVIIFLITLVLTLLQWRSSRTRDEAA